MTLDDAITVMRNWRATSTVYSEIDTAIDRVLYELQVAMEQVARLQKPSQGVVELQWRIAELNAEIARLKLPETDLEKKAWQLYSAAMLQELNRDRESVDKAWCFEAAQDFINYVNDQRKQVKP